MKLRTALLATLTVAIMTPAVYAENLNGLTVDQIPRSVSDGNGDTRLTRVQYVNCSSSDPCGFAYAGYGPDFLIYTDGHVDDLRRKQIINSSSWRNNDPCTRYCE
ncbi:MAG: hypothetical protein ACI9SY_000260 [Candidatus Paceibacteria bacterium]|jgi:hypothetical protein